MKGFIPIGTHSRSTILARNRNCQTRAPSKDRQTAQVPRIVKGGSAPARQIVLKPGLHFLHVRKIYDLFYDFPKCQPKKQRDFPNSRIVCDPLPIEQVVSPRTSRGSIESLLAPKWRPYEISSRFGVPSPKVRDPNIVQKPSRVTLRPLCLAFGMSSDTKTPNKIELMNILSTVILPRPFP